MNAHTPQPRSRREGGFLKRVEAYCPTAQPIRWMPPALVFVGLVLLRWFVLPSGEVGTLLQFLLSGVAAAGWYFYNRAGWLIMAAVAVFFFIVLLPFGVVDLFLVAGLAGGVWGLNRHLAATRQQPRPAYVVEASDAELGDDYAGQPDSGAGDGSRPNRTINPDAWYRKQ